MSDQTIRRSNFIVEQIKPLLAGEGPDAQGVVLAELVALFIAGHQPAVRTELLDIIVATVRELVPVMAHELGDPWKEEH